MSVVVVLFHLYLFRLTQRTNLTWSPPPVRDHQRSYPPLRSDCPYHIADRTSHNPFLDNVVVQRNVANIPETNNEHHVERREIFGEDDRDEVSREHVPTRTNNLAELSTVK